MGCGRSTVSPITGLTETDYVEHHEPFQFYASTRNPTHARPSSVSTIGFTDAANHQYDLNDWFDALAAGNLPAVSYLKPQAYQNAHPGNSNPLDEQAFIVNVVNTLQQSGYWDSTAVILAYDDSDGWYDHQMGPLVNGSFTTSDSLTGTNACGTSGVTPQLPGPNSNGAPVSGRCGYGPRQPLMVISPWAKPNYVDHTLTDQTFHPSLHRGQLEPGSDWHRLVRLHRRHPRQHVQLRTADRAEHDFADSFAHDRVTSVTLCWNTHTSALQDVS